MRTPVLLRLALGTLLATAACKKTPSKGECDQLLSHLIELETGAAGAGKTPEGAGDPKEIKAEAEKQKKAIHDYAIGQKFMETCTQKTPKKVVQCGIAAKSLEELAKCDGP